MAKYIKPTLDTAFHIDFSWWQQDGQNLRAYLAGHACAECQAAIDNDNPNQVLDWVSPSTGEVFQIDMLWHFIRKHCNDDPDFFDSRVPLTTAIFRAFIANNNSPLTSTEICERIGKKSPDLILKTIGARQVYKGIKPVATSG